MQEAFHSEEKQCLIRKRLVHTNVSRLSLSGLFQMKGHRALFDVTGGFGREQPPCVEVLVSPPAWMQVLVLLTGLQAAS